MTLSNYALFDELLASIMSMVVCLTFTSILNIHHLLAETYICVLRGIVSKEVIKNLILSKKYPYWYFVGVNGVGEFATKVD